MTKKRIVIAVALVLCCLAVVLCVGAFAEKPNYESVADEASLVYYEDVDAVIEESVLIVRAKKTAEEAVAYSLGNGFYDRHTLSTVKVLEVYKDSGDGEITDGSEIDILETQWTDEENKIIHHMAGYLKMEIGKEYLLCLKYNPNLDYYYPIGVLCGKVPVDEAETLFLGSGYKHVVAILEDLRNRYL